MVIVDDCKYIILESRVQHMFDSVQALKNNDQDALHRYFPEVPHYLNIVLIDLSGVVTVVWVDPEPVLSK